MHIIDLFDFIECRVMTKIWLLSDLHQEFVRDPEYGDHPHTAFDPSAHVPDDFDVVVLAGDIDVPLTQSLAWAADRFPGVPTIYVPGNHDFYVDPFQLYYTMHEQIDAGLEVADKLGINLLMDNTVVLDGTRFVGGTLWTDFATVGRGNISAKMAEAEGRNGMNDYRNIKRPSSLDPTKRKHLRPQDTIAAHRVTRDYIEAILSIEHAGPTCVVTHHAPHAGSIDPSRGGRLDWCYASNLSTIFEEPSAPDLWLHGHIHQAVDYWAGSTRIVSNPHGYGFMSNECENGFDPGLVVEIGDSLTPKYPS